MTEAERQAIYSLGGPLAERRVCRPKPDGWRLFLTPQQASAVHESGHAIVAAALGWTPTRVSIIPDPQRRVGATFSAGHCIAITQERNPGPPYVHTQSQAKLDRSIAARIAQALTPQDAAPRWKAVLGTIRLWEQQTKEILEANWLYVLALASDLERRKEMTQPEIAEYTKRLRGEFPLIRTLACALSSLPASTSSRTRASINRSRMRNDGPRCEHTPGPRS